MDYKKSRGRYEDKPSSSPAEEPKHSRLFILCGKSVREDDLKEAFGPFGEIDYVSCKKDRATGNFKGRGSSSWRGELDIVQLISNFKASICHSEIYISFMSHIFSPPP